MDPARATSLEPQWLEQGALFLGWIFFSYGRVELSLLLLILGREERTRSLGRDTRRRAMSQARGSSRLFDQESILFHTVIPLLKIQILILYQKQWWVENRDTSGQVTAESDCESKSRSFHRLPKSEVEWLPSQIAGLILTSDLFSQSNNHNHLS